MVTPTYDRDGVTIFNGDALAVLRDLPDESVNCCVTSPPYWGLRDYGVAGQLGLEKTPDEYVSKIVDVFREVRRVLADDGTLWLNIGDSYAATSKNRTEAQASNGTGLQGGLFTQFAILRQQSKVVDGLKPKDMVGIPWRVAFALQADGWYLRQDIVWSKPNVMPESVRDRCTKSHEYIFLLSRCPRYHFNQEAIKEPASPDTHARYARGRSGDHKWADGGPGNQTLATSMEHMRKPGVNPKAAQNANGSRQNASFSEAVKDIVDERNKRSVWTVPTHGFPGAHFATFPPKLIEPCILAGCPAGGVVLDPFLGSGTTAAVAQRLGCKCVGIELNEKYIELATKRLRQGVLDLTG